ncbi:hypothetical protein JW898_05815 [Candidatus Woesearchaeota archaeon]|nr:hypothetical protein [Candidatus Woesearchaeota archaeon]
MKSLIFDAGPVISLTTNNLLWTLDCLKEMFKGEFYIPRAVKAELVDRPLASKKFKFEALQVGFRIKNGVLTVLDEQKMRMLAEELLELANHSFKVRGNWLKIAHYAEMEVLAAASILNASAVVIDERTTKLLIEDQSGLARMLEKNMGSKVYTDQANLNRIKNWTRGIKVIRSVELVMVAYEKGIFNKYLPDGEGAARTLVESLLWGVKLHGCALSRQELNDLVRIETGNTLNPINEVSRQEKDNP